MADTLPPMDFPAWEPVKSNATAIPTPTESTAPKSNWTIALGGGGLTSASLMTANPWVIGGAATIDLLSKGFQMYQNEKGRRAQARSIQREIARQERIRQNELVQNQLDRQMQMAFAQEGRTYDRKEYEIAKRIEFFNRSIAGIKDRIQTESAMKQMLFNRTL